MGSFYKYGMDCGDGNGDGEIFCGMEKEVGKGGKGKIHRNRVGLEKFIGIWC